MSFADKDDMETTNDPFPPEMVSSGPTEASHEPNEVASKSPVPDDDAPAPVPSQAAHNQSTSTSTSGQSKMPKGMEQRINTIERLCHGHTFPVQLMLLLKSKIARGCLFWSIEGNGNTFILDCDWFSDEIMNKFFPGNQFGRITLALKRW